MNKEIFSGSKDKFAKQGVIKISHARISHIKLKYSRKPNIQNITLDLSKFIVKDEQTEFEFNVKKLNKGEFAKRNGGFTHELKSKSLLEHFETDRQLFIKLNLFESIKISCNLGKYYVQSADFKRKLLTHIINTLTSFVIGLLIGYYIVK